MAQSKGVGEQSYPPLEGGSIRQSGSQGVSERGDTGFIALGAAPDASLKGGLALARLHELAPAAPIHGGAATGFALALAALAGAPLVWVQQEFASLELGASYGLGCALFGIDPSRLLIVRAGDPKDALFAMEEALKARVTVIGELAQDGHAADLTATRRLSLAAQKGGGLALLLRHRTYLNPSAAETRWEIAAATGEGDRFGGLGRPAFALTLLKNRRGPCGDWVMQWDCHEQRFIATLPVAVAAPSADGPAGAYFSRAV